MSNKKKVEYKKIYILLKIVLKYTPLQKILLTNIFIYFLFIINLLLIKGYGLFLFSLMQPLVT